MASTELEDEVREHLADSGPIEQNDLVSNINSEENVDPNAILGTLRTLMDRDEISYTVDWDLQVEE